MNLFSKTADAYYRDAQRVARLSPQDLIYLQALLDDYRMLRTDVVNEEARAVVDAIARRADKREPLTLTDLQGLETALICLAPLPILHRQAWYVRARYRDMVGTDTYELYLSSNPPGIPSGADSSGRRRPSLRHSLAPGSAAPAAQHGHEPLADEEADLRADLLSLLVEIHWLEIYWPSREKQRTLLFLAASVLAVTLVIAGMIIYLRSSITGVHRVTTLTLVGISGVIGGFISTQARLYGLPKGVRMVNLYELKLSPLSVLQAPVSGGVFAIVLYLIFLGGFLQGDLFPTMALTTRPTNGEILKYRNLSDAASKQALASKMAADQASIAAEQADADSMKAAATANALIEVNKSSPAAANAMAAALKATALAAARRQAEADAAHQAELDMSAYQAAAAQRTEKEQEANTASRFTWTNLDITEPATVPDFGKLLVWAFIAGFAERFVPDTLQRIIGKSRAIKSSGL